MPVNNIYKNSARSMTLSFNDIKNTKKEAEELKSELVLFKKEQDESKTDLSKGMD